MPRRGRPSGSPERREQILDAALRCFVERGFHGTAVPAVAKEARMAAGTLYHYFDGKEALVNALYRKWKMEIARRVMSAFPATAPFREQFRVMWLEMVDFARTHPDAFAFLELHHHQSYLDDESRAMENRLKDFSNAMVARAQAQGRIRPGSPTLLSELVFGAFIGLMRAHQEGRLELSDADVALAEAACWDAIAVVEPAVG